eukprot:195697-Rhodomonas_salina.1
MLLDNNPDLPCMNGRQSDSRGVHEDRKRSRAQSKSDKEVASIMKQYGVGSPKPTSPSQSGGSPEGKWKKLVMKAHFHGKSVRNTREAIAAEAEALAYYEHTKAALKMDLDNPTALFFFQRAQLALEKIMKSGEELHVPSPAPNLSSSTSSKDSENMSSRGTPSSRRGLSPLESPASSTGGLAHEFYRVAMDNALSSDSELEVRAQLDQTLGREERARERERGRTAREREERNNRVMEMEGEERVEQREREEELKSEREREDVKPVPGPTADVQRVVLSN